MMRKICFWMNKRKKCRRLLTFYDSGSNFPQAFLYAAIFVLLGISFITTIVFLEYVGVNNARARSYNLAPYSLRDGSRPLKSLKSLLSPDEVAAFFAVEPAVDTRLNTPPPTAPPSPLPQGCYACSSEVPVVCPELEIPSLVGEVKPNTDDRVMESAEETVFGMNQSAIRAAVKRTNQMLTKYLEKPLNNSRKGLDPTVISSEASLIGGYKYLPGGHWIPNTCLPRWKVAVIIPYRNRSHHLPVLLNHLVPFLQRQKLEFGIYIVEQANNLYFNRAMLMNIGYLEALNFTKWDCFIFHDVDHLPKNDNNYYGCSGMPRHFLSGADRWEYKLPYDDFFGAVTGLTSRQIEVINGFPNVYWGWGGEDDEIWKRCKEMGLEITRVKGPKGHYDVITHHHHSAPKSEERMKLLDSFKPRFRKDGLVNIIYSRPTYTLHPLYVNITVNIQKVKGDVQQPKPDPVKPTSAGKKSAAVANEKVLDPRAVQGKRYRKFRRKQRQKQ